MVVTTIGFGDIFPFTILGRVVIALFSFVGLILFSFLVATFISFIEFTNTENINFNFYKRVELREDLKN